MIPHGMLAKVLDFTKRRVRKSVLTFFGVFLGAFLHQLTARLFDKSSLYRSPCEKYMQRKGWKISMSYIMEVDGRKMMRKKKTDQRKFWIEKIVCFSGSFLLQGLLNGCMRVCVWVGVWWINLNLIWAFKRHTMAWDEQFNSLPACAVSTRVSRIIIIIRLCETTLLWHADMLMMTERVRVEIEIKISTRMCHLRFLSPNQTLFCYSPLFCRLSR